MKTLSLSRLHIAGLLTTLLCAACSGSQGTNFDTTTNSNDAGVPETSTSDSGLPPTSQVNPDPVLDASTNSHDANDAALANEDAADAGSNQLDAGTQDATPSTDAGPPPLFTASCAGTSFVAGYVFSDWKYDVTVSATGVVTAHATVTPYNAGVAMASCSGSSTFPAGGANDDVVTFTCRDQIGNMLWSLQLDRTTRIMYINDAAGSWTPNCN